MRALLASSAFAISLALAISPASARECQYWSGNGPGVYGLTNGLDEGYASHVDQAGLGGLRMAFRIDTQTTWNQALFDQYDAYMAVAKEHGLDVLGIVLYESTTEGQDQWNCCADATGLNPYVQVFVDTAKTLMSRYGDQVKTWEIWNEPNAWTNANYANDPTHAGGTYILPQVYAKILAETFVQAQPIIASKGLHLVAGGLFAHDIGGSFSPATDYAKQVFDLGPWDWMQQNYGRRYPWDGFGYHVYIDQGGATSSSHLLQYLDAIQALKAQYSDGSPLWITEFGWQAPKAVSESTQAANLDTALAAFESRGDVARTFVFKVDDYDDWGLFHGDWTPKPAVATYATHDKGCTHLPAMPLDAGAGDASAPGADASADAGSGDGSSTTGGRDAAAGPDSGAGDGAASPGAASGCSCAAAPADRGAPMAWLAALAAVTCLRRHARRFSVARACEGIAGLRRRACGWASRGGSGATPSRGSRTVP